MGLSSARIAVIGAGAFGGWTALELQRHGAAVTVIDAWGPGNVRASSGGETRVIRATYGIRSHYTAMAARALELWREYDARWQRGFLRPIGVLWMFGESVEASAFARESAAALGQHGLPVEHLTPSAAARRYPQIRFDDVVSVMFEREAGYLLARRSCEEVLERFVDRGGTYRLAAATVPITIDGSRLRCVVLQDGTRLDADAFVFAAGPWLGAMFPEVIGSRVTATRQEVFYFGPPAGDPRFTDAGLPAWIDYQQTQMYGIPGNAHRGFKVADDAAGAVMDPTSADREATGEQVARARAFLSRRFPALADAPLVGSEVCQYESTPDSDFIIDRHPQADNVWIAGGGSGHGFKMGPAIGEMLASLVLGAAEPDPRYTLARFARPPRAGFQQKWV